MADCGRKECADSAVCKYPRIKATEPTTKPSAIEQAAVEYVRAMRSGDTTLGVRLYVQMFAAVLRQHPELAK